MTASWVGKAQWSTWEKNAVVSNCQKNVMLVPFYVVFCHHRKVSEYTVNCHCICFFVFIWLHKTSQCPHAYPPTTAETKKKGDMSIRTRQLDNRLWWVTISFTSYGWLGAVHSLPGEQLAAECPMKRMQTYWESMPPHFCFEGGSIKKEAGGHNLIPDRYTSHQIMLSKFLGTSLL